MSNDTPTKRPSHRLCAVKDNGGAKAKGGAA
jgi:hypothetical protein